MAANSNSFFNNSNITNTTNSERIQKLSERLQNIQSSIETDKGSTNKNLNDELAIFEKFKKNCERSQSQLTMLKNHLSNIEKAVDAEKQHREEVIQEKLKERQALENKITAMIEEHSRIRKESEDKTIQEIEQKADEIQEDLLRERNIRNQNLDRIKDYQENS
ncbi:unnamed protein product [Moneuplotes crassus]|uniref:Uncharacterized protein n=1 Tax=Euplotes crassus TaxID=5936 RepID=A0AAD1XSU8_EUPCR|nr:unnamed protein product [Moneuplotes crassus]